jgi:hypothetical protein
MLTKPADIALKREAFLEWILSAKRRLLEKQIERLEGQIEMMEIGAAIKSVTALWHEVRSELVE